MTNTAIFTAADLQSIAGPAAEHLAHGLVATGVSTDTRTIVQGNLFVALHGEHFDGHEHIDTAFARGAVLAVVSQRYFDAADAATRVRLLPCTDTLTALGALARYHRCRFDYPVIAIAGAAGKTSTKELVAHVLGTVMPVASTQANYNNRVGTPLTLLQLTHEHQAAVIEIGTNEPGEIEDLCAMALPTHGLITNIGKEHLEKLVDLDGVEREETALFRFLDEHGGLLLVNVDDARLRKYAVPTASPLSTMRVVSFGIDFGGNVQPVVEFDEELHPVLSITSGTFSFRVAMHTQGIAAARNAVAAMAVAWALRLSASETRKALATYQPPESHGYARLAVHKSGQCTILNDTYNANPESMLIALETLQRFPASYRIAVLGDMRELGEAAAVEHDDVCRMAAESADYVVVTGEEFRRSTLRLHLANVHWKETHQQCVEAVHEQLVRGGNTTVLVKGSRGLQMEKVVHALLHGS